MLANVRWVLSFSNFQAIKKKQGVFLVTSTTYVKNSRVYHWYLYVTVKTAKVKLRLPFAKFTNKVTPRIKSTVKVFMMSISTPHTVRREMLSYSYIDFFARLRLAWKKCSWWNRLHRRRVWRQKQFDKETVQKLSNKNVRISYTRETLCVLLIHAFFT